MPSAVRQIAWQEHDMFYQDLPAKASPHNILNCFQTTIPERGGREYDALILLLVTFSVAYLLKIFLK